MRISTKRKNIFVSLLCSFLLGICFVLGVGCTNTANVKIRFDAGETMSLYLGESKMLACTVDEGGEDMRITLSSENTDIVTVNANGYATAKGLGETTVTATLENGASARIRITVYAPEIENAEFLRSGVNMDSHCSLRIELSKDVALGEAVYVEAKQAGATIGRTTKTLENSRLLFVPLSELGVEENGIYEFGAALCKKDTNGEVVSIATSDGLEEYTLAKSEPWRLINSEIRQDGMLSIVNMKTKHGGAKITFDVSDYKKGSDATNNILVRVSSGVKWSAKLSRGDGVDDLYEEVVLDDVAVSAVKELSIPLCEYEKYIRGGKVSLVFYAIEGDLKVEMIRYGMQGGYNLTAVKRTEYISAQGVKVNTHSFVETGEENIIKADSMPINATFVDYTFLSDSEDLTIVKTSPTTAKFIAKKNGEYTITVKGITASETKTVQITAGVSAKSMEIDKLIPYITLDKSVGSFDFGACLTVLPTNTTQSKISYEILQSTSTGAGINEQGVVSFTNTGVIKLKAILVENETIYKTFELRIEDGLTASESVSVTADKTLMRIGDTATLTATVMPSNATYSEIEWQSSNPDILSVDGDGKVTALASGTASIYAIAKDGQSYGEIALTCQATRKLAVNPATDDYVLFIIDNNTKAGDEIKIEILSNGTLVDTINYVVPEAEKDGAKLGLLEAQRRLLIPTAGLSVGEYEFVLTLTRGDNEATPFDIEELRTVSVGKDTLNAEWVNDYEATAEKTADGLKLQIQDKFGYISTEITTEEIGDYLILTTIRPDTIEKISIKLRFGEEEISLTPCDMTSRGVWYFNLPDLVGEELTENETFELLIYGVGEDGDEIVFDKIFFTK